MPYSPPVWCLHPSGLSGKPEESGTSQKIQDLLSDIYLI